MFLDLFNILQTKRIVLKKLIFLGISPGCCFCRRCERKNLSKNNLKYTFDICKNEDKQLNS